MDDVVCAQAFHWFATPAAVAEMRRALVRDDVLGLIRNGRDEDVPSVAALSEKITDRREGDTPRYRSGAWSQAFPAPGLAFVDEQHLRNSHIGVAEDVVLKHTVSVSFTAGLPEHRRLDVERDVRSLSLRRMNWPTGSRSSAVPPNAMQTWATAIFQEGSGPRHQDEAPTLL